MQKGGCSQPKPISGGREHDVANLSAAARRGGGYSASTCQNQRTGGESAW